MVNCLHCTSNWKYQNLKLNLISNSLACKTDLISNMAFHELILNLYNRFKTLVKQKRAPELHRVHCKLKLRALLSSKAKKKVWLGL